MDATDGVLPAGALSFEIEIQRPDPSAEKMRLRRGGMVLAFYQGTEAGVLTYGVGPGDTVQIVNIETHDPFKCRTCATQMTRALKEAFPHLRVVDGGNSNSESGNAVLRKFRDAGLVGEA